MIIRRRHTANFTTIGNALFNDERLEADEIGVLGFLLSRPDDWEVRRPQLAKRFRIGRDSIKRIIFNCMRTGWMVAKRTRLTNGTFHTIYEVRDEPGPTLTPDEVKAALSLVSGEASEVYEGEKSESDSSAAAVDQLPETGGPPTGQPGVADHLRQTRPGSIEDSLNPDSVKPESTKPVRGFAEVLEAWDKDHINSPFTAEQAYVGLPEAMKAKAFDCIRPYLADRKARTLKLCDLTTYLRERRWERFEVRPEAPKPFYVLPRSPQAHRWREYYERCEPHQIKKFEMFLSRGGYTAPSEWPPAMAGKAAAQPLSEDDSRAFTGS